MINAEKTNVMAVGQQSRDMNKLENERMEQVEHTYVMTADEKCMKNVKRTIGLTSAMVNKFSKLWRSYSISNKTKVNVYETFIVPVQLYGSEC